MIKIKIDNITEDETKKYFHVSAEIGTQRSRSRYFKTRDIIFSIDQILQAVEKSNDLTDLEFLPSESVGQLKFNSHKGVCVFKKKTLDIPVNYVKIDIPIVEAEFPPLVDEEKPKEEKASLSSEKLPIGLKKAKKKRTTKKKTEE